jgi:hypothetical protein
MSILITKNPSTEMDVRMVPVPEATRSYTPMPHADLIDTIEVQLKHHLPQYNIHSKQFGLARDGDQMFGMISLKKEPEYVDVEIVDPDDNLDLSIGFRNSYDKSMSVGVVGGGKVFICDNMMMHSDAIKIMKRHTKNVMREFDYMLYTSIPELENQFVTIVDAKKQLGGVEIEHEQGYEFLGRMFGHKLLTPVQMSSAVEDWRSPNFEVFKERSAWSLYNAATWGLKKGSPSLAMNRYCNAHDWFMDNLNRLQ